MANPLAGLGNISEMLSLKQINNPGDGPLNIDLKNFQNIDKLDNFLGSNDLGGNESSDLLKGMVSKVEQLEEANLSPDKKELLNDLQQLIGDQAFSSDKSAQKLADTFSDVLGNYMNNVNEKHGKAVKAIEKFATGGDIDLHSVMIASEKASLSTQLTLQLRNKLVQAYKEIQNIRV